MGLQALTNVARSETQGLSVEISSVDLVAPAGVFFELKGFSTDIYQNAGIWWTFNDGAGSYDLLPALWPAQLKSKSKQPGTKTSRVFESAGTVRWACYVRYTVNGVKQQKVIRGTLTITADTFTDANTFYISPTSDFTNEAAGATNQFTSWAAAYPTIRARSDDVKVCFNRGESHTNTGQVRFDVGSGGLLGQTLVVDAYGVGDRPILDDDRFYAYRPGALKMLNIHLSGTYDVEGGTFSGSSYSGLYAYNDREDEELKILIHDCEVSGLATSVYFAGLDYSWPGLAVVSDPYIHDWQNYGCLAVVQKLALIGVVSAQNPDALCGGDGDNHDDVGNDHGPLRASRFESLSVWACDLFSNNGWATASLRPSHNPALRLLSSSIPLAEASVVGTILEGGSYVASLDSSAASSDPNQPALVRMSSCYLMGTSNGYFTVNLSYGGTSMDNCVLVQPDVPVEGNEFFHWMGFTDLDQEGEEATENDPSNFTYPMSIRNNTFVFLGTDQFSSGQHTKYEGIIDDYIRGVSPTFVGSSWENNYEYSPSRSFSPQNNGDPINTTLKLMTPRYKGYRAKFDIYDGTLASDVADGETLTINYSEGDASYFEASEGKISVNDSSDSATFSYGSSSVAITNASGKTWLSGTDYRVALTRTAGNMPAVDTAFATPSASGSAFAPSTGSSALGAATGNIAELDFFGEIRSASTAIGAFDGVVS